MTSDGEDRESGGDGGVDMVCCCLWQVVKNCSLFVVARVGLRVWWLVTKEDRDISNP